VVTRVLVTGVAGFTGRYLAPLLAAQGHEIHGLVHRRLEELPEGVHELHEADLADEESVAVAVAAARPDLVVHLAAIAFVGHGDIGEMYRTNVVGTRYLLEALAKAPDRPTMVLLASSANIYGNAHEGVIDETMPPSPANDYGVSKVAMEAIARLYSERLPIVVVRPFNYTGLGQTGNFLIPKIVEHARERQPFIELGNVDVARDFSDVRSVVEIYARLLREPRAIGGVFNVCSGRAVTLREILAEVEDLSGHTMELRINPAFVRANEVRILFGSAALLSGVIGRLPQFPLRETLSWMMSA
jgi:nucleoside-diphosphate-sugar epimerase